MNLISFRVPTGGDLKKPEILQISNFCQKCGRFQMSVINVADFKFLSEMWQISNFCQKCGRFQILCQNFAYFKFLLRCIFNILKRLWILNLNSLYWMKWKQILTIFWQFYLWFYFEFFFKTKSYLDMNFYLREQQRRKNRSLVDFIYKIPKKNFNFEKSDVYRNFLFWSFIRF